VFLSLPVLVGFPLDRYKNDLKSQAHELLKDGITPDETEKALDILLKLQSGFLPKDYIEANPTSLRGWYILVTCAALFGIIGLIPPKTNLGLGKGEQRVKRWIIWIRVVSVVIPTGIILPIVLNKLSAVF
jgi:hypothetical protein